MNYRSAISKKRDDVPNLLPVAKGRIIVVGEKLRLADVEYLVRIARDGAEDDAWRADETGRAGKDAVYRRELAIRRIAKQYGWVVF